MVKSFKFLILGNHQSGKTLFINSLLNHQVSFQKLDSTYIPTNTINVQTLQISYRRKNEALQPLEVNLYEVPVQSIHEKHMDSIYKGIDGAFILFHFEDGQSSGERSVEMVPELFQLVRNKVGLNTKIVLIETKCFEGDHEQMSVKYEPCFHINSIKRINVTQPLESLLTELIGDYHIEFEFSRQKGVDFFFGSKSHKDYRSEILSEDLERSKFSIDESKRQESRMITSRERIEAKARPIIEQLKKDLETSLNSNTYSPIERSFPSPQKFMRSPDKSFILKSPFGTTENDFLSKLEEDIEIKHSTMKKELNNSIRTLNESVNLSLSDIRSPDQLKQGYKKTASKEVAGYKEEEYQHTPKERIESEPKEKFDRKTSEIDDIMDQSAIQDSSHQPRIPDIYLDNQPLEQKLSTIKEQKDSRVESKRENNQSTTTQLESKRLNSFQEQDSLQNFDKLNRKSDHAQIELQQLEQQKVDLLQLQEKLAIQREELESIQANLRHQERSINEKEKELIARESDVKMKELKLEKYANELSYRAEKVQFKEKELMDRFKVLFEPVKQFQEFVSSELNQSGIWILSKDT